MLRLVIQLSMFLALPLMAVCCFIQPAVDPLVRLLRAAVQHAGRAGVLGRQRHQRTRTADARTAADHHAFALADSLGQDALQPAGLLVLTAFLVWPLLLAWLLPPWTYSRDTPTMLGYMAIIVMSCLTTTILAMFCSVLFRKTTTAMMTAYIVIMLLYAAPLAVEGFARLKYPECRLHLLDRQTDLHQPLCRRLQPAACTFSAERRHRGQLDGIFRLPGVLRRAELGHVVFDRGIVQRPLAGKSEG